MTFLCFCLPSFDQVGSKTAVFSHNLTLVTFSFFIFFFLHLADMRRDVQDIFRITPHEKQVMMFSATLSKEIRPVCRKFMQDVSKLLHL